MADDFGPLLIPEQPSCHVEDFKQPLCIGSTGVESQILIVEVVYLFRIDVAESILSASSREIKHRDLRSQLAKFSAVLNLLRSHEHVEEIMSRISSQSRLSAEAKNEVGELSRPSIALLLRVERHSCLKAHEEVACFVRVVRFDLNHAERRLEKFFLEGFIELLKGLPSPRARLFLDELWESSLRGVLARIEEFERSLMKL